MGYAGAGSSFFFNEIVQHLSDLQIAGGVDF
jgi:hypothetical protein